MNPCMFLIEEERDTVVMLNTDRTLNATGRRNQWLSEDLSK